MISCLQLVSTVIIILIGFIIHLLYDNGEFTILYPQNIRHCKRIEGYKGCEDFAYFSNKDIYMSCDDRSWLAIKPGQHNNLSTRIALQKNQGNIYYLRPNSYDKPQPVTIIGSEKSDFHPLGIASLEQQEHGNIIKYLFVTNHQRNGEYIKTFEITENTKLKLISQLYLEPFQLINNIIAISKYSFYVTISTIHEPGTFKQVLDIILRQFVSYVLFCEYNKCRKVVQGLKMANGITKSFDSKRIYVIDSLDKTMNIYDRNEANNDLKLVKKVKTLSKGGCDNIEMAMNGIIYMGCQPKAITLIVHMMYPNEIISPSLILKYVDNNSDDDKMETVMVSIGEIFSASSTAFKLDNTLFVGTVDDNSYLLCNDNQSKNYSS